MRAPALRTSLRYSYAGAAYSNPDAPTQIANGVSTTDIYNLYHNNSSGSPGLGQATQLVSGQNDEGPINMNSKSPDWLKTIIRIAAGTTIASGLACGELARLSQLAAEIGVSTAKNAKNASPIKATARKSRRSEDQVAFHVA